MIKLTSALLCVLGMFMTCPAYTQAETGNSGAASWMKAGPTYNWMIADAGKPETAKGKVEVIRPISGKKKASPESKAVDSSEAVKGMKVQLVKAALARRNPSPESKIVGTLRHGLTFNVEDTKTTETQTWYQVKSKAYGSVWIAASNTRFVYAKPEHTTHAPVGQISSDVQKLDALAADIGDAVGKLKSGSERVLAGIAHVSKEQCSATAKKTILEIYYEDSPARGQSINAISGEITTLSQKVDKLIAIYKKKIEAIKQLDDKLAKVNQNRKVLADIQMMVGEVKDSDIDVGAISTTDGIDLLNKRIDDALLHAENKQTALAAVTMATPENVSPVQIPAPITATTPDSDSPAPIAAPKPLNASHAPAAPVRSTVPQWVLDTVQAKGHEMSSANYGQVTVVKEGGVTIMVVKKDGEQKFKNIYGKLIKESYEGNGSFYFVLNMPEEQG